MTTFGIYMVGFGVLVAGLALAAFLMGVPVLWIAITVVIMAAIGYVIASRSNN